MNGKKCATRTCIWRDTRVRRFLPRWFRIHSTQGRRLNPHGVRRSKPCRINATSKLYIVKPLPCSGSRTATKFAHLTIFPMTES